MNDSLREQLQTSLGTAYTLERELGGGGMSRVFVAREEALGRDVVVKVLAPELAEGLSAERFTREIRLAAALQEPHIVPVLAAGATGKGLPYYTMPFVRGASLRQRLADGPVPLPEAVDILRDVAWALAHAHAQGIVHRDIKPENVLLSSGTAVVTDFGIAKAVSAARTVAPGGTLTQVGTSLGTPAYMAPEQAVGDDVDHRADLYAWGVVAYELLAGRHPFAGKTTAQQLVAAHVAEVPTSLRQAAPAVPAPLAALVMRCLEKSPTARPAAADELIAALKAVLPWTGGAAAAGSAPRHSKRRRAGVIAGVIVLALGAGALAFATLRPRATAATAEPTRVLVLPLENATGDPALDLVGRMAADWLTRGLVESGRVDVIDPAELADRTVSAAGGRRAELARLTHAGTVVAGSFYRSGDSLLFGAKVHDERAGTVTSTIGPVAGLASAPLQGVERLRALVVAQVVALVDPNAAAMLELTGTAPTFDAYQAFMKGEDAAARFDSKRAVEHYLSAARLDTSFLVPFVRAIENTPCPRADSLARVLAPHRARLGALAELRVDGRLAECRGDLPAAYAVALRAVELAPRSTLAQLELAGAEVAVHRFHAARTRYERLDPARLPPTVERRYYNGFTYLLHLLGDYEAELALARRALARYPDNLATRLALTMPLAALGREAELQAQIEAQAATGGQAETQLAAIRTLRYHGHEQAARALAERSLALPLAGSDDELRFAALYTLGRFTEARAVVDSSKADPVIIHWRGAAAAKVGDTAGAERALAALTPFDTGAGRGPVAFGRAGILAALGRRDDAVRALAEARRHGFWANVWLLRLEGFESLRGYPPAEALIRPVD